MNEHDAERLRAVLEGEGLTRVARPDDADVLVYNTCTVRRSADERFFGHLGDASRLKKDDPARRVIVCGCLPQAEGIAFLDEHPFVDAALGPQNLHGFPMCSTSALRSRRLAAGRSRGVRRRERTCSVATCRGASAPTRRGCRSCRGARTSARTASCPTCGGGSAAGPPSSPRRGPGARRRRGPRGHSPWPERERLRPRPAPRRSG